MAEGNTSGIDWRKRIIGLENFFDERGGLVPCEGDIDIPFSIRRAFWIHNVPKGKRRGVHKHEKCIQAIFAIHGLCDLEVDGIKFTLINPSGGVVVYPHETVTLSNFRMDAVVLVLCSEHYDPEDVVND